MADPNVIPFPDQLVVKIKHLESGRSAGEAPKTGLTRRRQVLIRTTSDAGYFSRHTNTNTSVIIPQPLVYLAALVMTLSANVISAGAATLS